MGELPKYGFILQILMKQKTAISKGTIGFVHKAMLLFMEALLDA